MKFTVTLQTLILGALALVLVLATAVWGAVVYTSLYGVIIRGFDGKLLALSGSAAAFTDGDGHAGFQRRREITALTAGRDALIGYDRHLGELVRIDPADGGALALNAAVAPVRLRALAFIPALDLLAGLAGDGRTLHLYSAKGDARGTVATRQLDGLLIHQGRLAAWRDRTIYHLEAASGAAVPAGVSLAQDARALVEAPDGSGFVGLDQPGQVLLRFNPAGQIERRLPLHAASVDAMEAAPPELSATGGPGVLHALATHRGSLWGAARSLTRIDLATGQLVSDFPPGYLTERHPFYRKYVPAFRAVLRATGLTYFYTEVYLGNKRIYYGLDGSFGNLHSRPGSEDILPDESDAGFRQVQQSRLPFVSGIQHWERWGLMKVSAQPILDSSGTVVAVAGADVNITMIRYKTREALFAVIFIGIASLFAAGIVSWRVADSLTRPLRDIKDCALWMAAGYRETVAAADGAREVRALGQNLNALTQRLQQQAVRSRKYQREIAVERERSLLHNALAGLGARSRGAVPPDACARLIAGTSGKPALIGVEWRRAGGVAWLFTAGSDPLQLASWQARAGALARALVPRDEAGELLSKLLHALPSLAAVAHWDAVQHILLVRCRQAVPLLLVAPMGDLTLHVCSGALTLSVQPGHGVIFSAAAGCLTPAHLPALAAAARIHGPGTVDLSAIVAALPGDGGPTDAVLFGNPDISSS